MKAKLFSSIEKMNPITFEKERWIMTAFVGFLFAMITLSSIFVLEPIVSFVIILYSGFCLVGGLIIEFKLGKFIEATPWVGAIFLALAGSYSLHEVWPSFLAPILVLGAVFGIMYSFAYIIAKIPTIPKAWEFTITVS